jgi:hypothetical protein
VAAVSSLPIPALLAPCHDGSQGTRRQPHFPAELVGRRVLVPGPMCKGPGRHSTPQSALADLRPVPVAGRCSAGRLVIRQQIRETCPPTDPQEPRSLATT